MQERSGSQAPALAGIIIDVPSGAFDATVAFWAGALSAPPEALSGMPGGDAYVRLPGATAVTDVVLQRIDDTDRPRFHLDIAVLDRADAVQRAADLGGKVVQHEEDWDVLIDPAGLPLCVGFEDLEPLQTAPRPPDRGYLDAIFIDVPPDRVTAEVVFWSAVLDATPVPPDASDPAYHPLAGVRAVGGEPVVVEVQTTLPDPARDGVATAPRIHVDLSATDVDEEVARLTALGARHVDAVVAPGAGRVESAPGAGRVESAPGAGRVESAPGAGRVERDWVTLADPAGNLFCVVPATPERA
ncbi:VOC family protein [Nitriliruptor alkaliphilus]|uniref:VOC family protein n=1 Tax=Nitriliruptor alkaliphilus TaxID=427918 RepID=UPI0012EDA990|nr:VOC family protein [Nitriliruptor alkaliphilus]